MVRLSRAWLGCALLSLTGCVVESHPAVGDLTFTWTFVGSDCVTAGVATVSVRLFDDGGAVVSTDSLACSQRSITYKSLNDGVYHASLDGFSSGGARLYQGDADVQVQTGDNQYGVDLQLAQ